MINLENISKTFNTGKPNQVNAVDGVSLQINRGEFVVIVGANGSGKTIGVDANLLKLVTAVFVLIIVGLPRLTTRSE